MKQKGEALDFQVAQVAECPFNVILLLFFHEKKLNFENRSVSF